MVPEVPQVILMQIRLPSSVQTGPCSRHHGTHRRAAGHLDLAIQSLRVHRTAGDSFTGSSGGAAPVSPEDFSISGREACRAGSGSRGPLSLERTASLGLLPLGSSETATIGS